MISREFGTRRVIIIWRLPPDLDDDTFIFIRQERAAAKSLFLTPDELPTSLATAISSTVTSISTKVTVSTDEPKPAAPGGAGRLMTAEEKERVKAAIVNATSAEEVRRLERSLKEGWMPDA